MLTLLKWFFLTLGVIFFCLLVAGTYLVVADPFELRPLFALWQGGVPSVGQTLESPSTTEAPVVATETLATSADITTTTTVPEVDVASTTPTSLLTPGQQAALEFVGIDPDTLPTTITPEQEACFVETLGSARVDAIKAGAVPTPVEIIQARGCL
jgi:hypothetical protein